MVHRRVCDEESTRPIVITESLHSLWVHFEKICQIYLRNLRSERVRQVAVNAEVGAGHLQEPALERKEEIGGKDTYLVRSQKIRIAGDWSDGLWYRGGSMNNRSLETLVCNDSTVLSSSTAPYDGRWRCH